MRIQGRLYINGEWVSSAGMDEVGDMATAKLFRNGRSQAVRLPKAFRFEGEEVSIRRGDTFSTRTRASSR